MAKAPTSVTNPDGSITTTTYNADGTVYEVSTVSTAKDGSKTEVRKFSSGESTTLKWSPSGTFLGTASQGADGLLSYSDPKTGTRTTYSADGSTPLNRVTYNPDGSQTIDYLNAEDGSVNRTETKTAEQVRQDVVNAARDQDVANNTGKGSGNVLFNPGAVVNGDNAFAVKTAIDKLDPLGTPGFNDQNFNATLFGKPKTGNGSIFTNDAIGNTLGKVATVYGLGSLNGDGTGSGGTGGGGTGSGSGGSITPGGSPTAGADLAAFQKQLADSAAANSGDRAPPTVTAGGYTAPTIAAPTPAAYSGYTAPTINAPPTISAGQVGPIERVTPTTISAGSVSAPVIAAPGTIKAGSITAPQIGVSDINKPGDITAQHIDRIMMDPTQTAESRDAMLKALSMAEGAANGTAPSAAVQLLQKAIDTNARQQLGAAGALQGRSPGAALRAGQQGLMAANAASAADMAALRAQEQATGRQQYGTFASSLYQNDVSRAAAQLGADVDVAKTNAINLLDAAKSNQSSALQTSIANMNKQVQVATANMNAALDAGKTNLAAAMQAQIENIRNTITVSTANASNELTSRIATLNAQMDAAKANQATALAAGQSNAANALNARIAQIQADLEASKANLAAVTQTNIANASLAADASKFSANAFNTASLADLTARTNVDINNASLSADASRFAADAANKAAAANQSAALQQQIIDNARAQGLRDDQIQLLLAQMGFNYKDKELALTKTLADQGAFASGLGTLAKFLSQSSGGSSATTPTKTPSSSDIPQVDWDDGITYGNNGSPILD